MASLCFQMGADIEDVDALLDRMRTTALTDYIRFDLNGDGDTDDIVDIPTDDGYIQQPESQPLQLISPAGVFKKYNMPQELPTEIKIGETLPLNKHFYNGVAFLIAGAEVLINGQWIAFSNENSTLVMAENPMTLQWRLNGELMQQYGYNDGDTIEGTIVAVDDEWNGLNHLSKTFSVMLKGNVTGVGGIEADSQTATSNVWYTISGQKLSKRPTTPGVYIRNGKKVVIQ